MIKYVCKQRSELNRIANKYRIRITPLYCNHIVVNKDNNEKDLAKK